VRQQQVELCLHACELPPIVWRKGAYRVAKDAHRFLSLSTCIRRVVESHALLIEKLRGAVVQRNQTAASGLRVEAVTIDGAAVSFSRV
jgi:hypothetical protein